VFKGNRGARWVVEVVIEPVCRDFRLVKMRIPEYRIATCGSAFELQIDLASTAAVPITNATSAAYIVLEDPNEMFGPKKRVCRTSH
jgi:hypothetical protein